MTLTLRYAARSDRGLVREGNQDSVYAGPRLLAVADGMGGMAAGDVASNLAIAAMAPLDEDVPGDSLVDALRAAVEMANQNLRDAVDANPALEGMGTTLTGMLFSGSKFGMVHVGDSRAYLLRAGEFTQVTKDDTYVQMLIDEGRITEEEASVHPQRSLLIRALQGSDVDPQYSVRPAVVGDRYLICSDGLPVAVSDENIAQTLRDYPDPDQCVDRLVQLALRGGAPDNVTVVVADVTDQDIVEGRPYVGGAAARDRGATHNGHLAESTPAARAAALTAPPRPGAPEDASAEEEEPDPKRHPGRTTVLLVVVLAILAGGAYGGWRYTQSRYYVGATSDCKGNGRVAVFQGVPGNVLGLKLNHVVENPTTPLYVCTLNVADQNAVEQGIMSGSLRDASTKLESLRTHLVAPIVPGCPTPSATPSTAPSTPAEAGATATPSGSVATPPPSDSSQVSPPPSRKAEAADKTAPNATTAPNGTVNAAAPATSPAPVKQPDGIAGAPTPFASAASPPTGESGTAGTQPAPTTPGPSPSTGC